VGEILYEPVLVGLARLIYESEWGGLERLISDSVSICEKGLM
jgi:hypothetical protein